MRIIFKKETLEAARKSAFFAERGKRILKAKSGSDEKFLYFKKKVIAHLNRLEEKEDAGINKAYIIEDMILKGGLPIGTIREWKGKKYIKIAQGKWRAKYDSETRGAKLSIAALKRKAEKCSSSQELLQLVLENRSRFSDKEGHPLPFVKELSSYVSSLNDKIEKQTETKAKTKKEPHLQSFETEYKKTKEWYENAKATSTEIESLEQEIRSLDRKIKSVKKQGMSDTNPTLAGWYGCQNAQKETLNELKAAKEAGFKTLKEYKNAKAETKTKKENKQSGGGGEPPDDKPKLSKESYTKTLRRKLKDNLRSQFGFHKNKKTGIEANLSGSSVDKMSSDKAIEKSKKNGFTVDEHFEAANKIVSLYENAVLTETAPDKKGSSGIKSIKRFDAALDLQSGEKATAHITVKESTRHGHKIYSVEVMELEKNSRSENRAGGWWGHQKMSPASISTIPQSGEKSSGIMQIRKKYESFKSITGNKKTVTLPDGTKIKCHYKLVEAEAPTASHDENTFSPTKGFPSSKDGKTVNDRDYQNDKDAQESVIKIAGKFNSLALESPPIVTTDGIVVSGNNRTMSSKLAAKNGTDAVYIADLKEMIDEYGLEESSLDGFKHPRLILEIDAEHEGEYTTEEFAQFNRDTKKTMSNVEKAVKITKTLNEEKIQSIASELSNYETMGELYADAKGCQRFVAKLIDAGIIGDNEKAQYLKTDGTLNDTGKDFTETVLVGSILNENNIRKLDSAGGKRIRQKLVRALLPLVENKGTGKEYSFNQELNEAVDIAVNVAKHHDKYPDVETYLAQGNLFEDKKPDEVTGKLAKLIHDEGEKAFALRMKNLEAGLKHSANGEMDIFLGEVETKQDLMNRFLSIQKSIAGILANLRTKERTIRGIVAEALANIA